MIIVINEYQHHVDNNGTTSYYLFIKYHSTKHNNYFYKHAIHINNQTLHIYSFKHIANQSRGTTATTTITTLLLFCLYKESIIFSILLIEVTHILYSEEGIIQ